MCIRDRGSSITITDDAGSQLLSDLGRSAIQGVSQYVSKKMRSVKVTLKAGYRDVYKRQVEDRRELVRRVYFPDCRRDDPTLFLLVVQPVTDETDKIMKAQMSRGADFESKNLVSRAKNLVPLLVPLFVSAFRRAEELAMAMEARCYRGGYNRTKMRQSIITKSD